MIESMTGYGKAIVQLPTKKVSIEIKTLNSKNLDINARVPLYYREKELEIRKKLAKNLVRGKVDFGMYIESTGVDNSVRINTELVQKYMDDLRIINSDSSDNLLEIAMRLPDTVSSIKEDLDPKEWLIINEAIDTAIKNLKEYRQAEGIVLQNDFVKRIQLITDLLDEVAVFDVERKSELRAKLIKAIDELKQKVDENRFEQELIYYLEKLDITEEQVRLKNHLEYYLEALHSNDSNGKKLGFITQEMGREINTIGSKANHASMQKIVVQMKDELEKIKEQNLNIL
jgi:uncharacterized protein (TIGR00255 family)